MAVVRVEANASGDAANDEIKIVGAYGAAQPKIVFDDAWTATHSPMKVLIALYRARAKLIQHLSGT